MHCGSFLSPWRIKRRLSFGMCFFCPERLFFRNIRSETGEVLHPEILQKQNPENLYSSMDHGICDNHGHVAVSGESLAESETGNNVRPAWIQQRLAAEGES